MANDNTPEQGNKITIATSIKQLRRSIKAYGEARAKAGRWDARGTHERNVEAAKTAPREYLCGISVALDEIAKLSRALPHWAPLRRLVLYTAWRAVLDVAFAHARSMKGGDDG